mmetsp:Transcript_29660/g.68007  ORF Transcript_29660/g.68007 Transcript_29660/m.68007 type:complete len:428 (-) Transcript_29660:381-1664(-)
MAKFEHRRAQNDKPCVARAAPNESDSLAAAGGAANEEDRGRAKGLAMRPTALIGAQVTGDGADQAEAKVRQLRGSGVGPTGTAEGAGLNSAQVYASRNGQRPGHYSRNANTDPDIVIGGDWRAETASPRTLARYSMGEQAESAGVTSKELKARRAYDGNSSNVGELAGGTFPSAMAALAGVSFRAAIRSVVDSDAADRIASGSRPAAGEKVQAYRRRRGESVIRQQTHDEAQEERFAADEKRISFVPNVPWGLDVERVKNNGFVDDSYTEYGNDDDGFSHDGGSPRNGYTPRNGYSPRNGYESSRISPRASPRSGRNSGYANQVATAHTLTHAPAPSPPLEQGRSYAPLVAGQAVGHGAESASSNRDSPHVGAHFARLRTFSLDSQRGQGAVGRDADGAAQLARLRGARARADAAILRASRDGLLPQ